MATDDYKNDTLIAAYTSMMGSVDGFTEPELIAYVCGTDNSLASEISEARAQSSELDRVLLDLEAERDQLHEPEAKTRNRLNNEIIFAALDGTDALKALLTTDRPEWFRERVLRTIKHAGPYTPGATEDINADVQREHNFIANGSERSAESSEYVPQHGKPTSDTESKLGELIASIKLFSGIWTIGVRSPHYATLGSRAERIAMFTPTDTISLKLAVKHVIDDRWRFTLSSTSTVPSEVGRSFEFIVLREPSPLTIVSSVGERWSEIVSIGEQEEWEVSLRWM